MDDFCLNCRELQNDQNLQFITPKVSAILLKGDKIFARLVI
jgi:hypothetical protein